MSKRKSGQELKAVVPKTIAAPDLGYLPPAHRNSRTPIGLIGCGGISEHHLKAYRAAGYNVVALCDALVTRVEQRRKEFFPDAQVYTDYRELLKRDDIEVVDLATHPQDREKLIPASLKARKHVLSQKPFVLDLDKGRRFAEMANKMGVKLAINQNGRWAPYFSYMRQAVNAGLIGDVFAVHSACHWNHEWIKDTHFNNVHHIILYDFAIHWFDILSCFMGDREPRRVSASLQYAPGQKSKPPMLGQTVVEFEEGHASLVFDAVVHHGQGEVNCVIGTKGTLESNGPICAATSVSVATKKGTGVADVSQGTWFSSGFHGAMAELLSAIEERREPENGATNNLRGLALSFAAVASAETGKWVEVGKARRVPVERCTAAFPKPDAKKVRR